MYALDDVTAFAQLAKRCLGLVIIDERILYMARCEARRLLTDVFGIAQEEVDAKVPDPDAEPEPEGR